METFINLKLLKIKALTDNDDFRRKKIMLTCIIQIDNKYFFNYSSFFLVYFWILSSKINNSDGLGCKENQNKVIWI